MKNLILFVIAIFYAGQSLSANEELKPFSALAATLHTGQIYEHYKGKQYKILSVARNSETLEESVVYQALYGNQDVWVRPLRMFLENVVVEGKSLPRFKLIRQ